MRYFLFLGAIIIMLGSCVPNRRYVYLQKDDLHNNKVEKNRIIREHSIDTFEYRIQPNDILSIRFESLTPQNFDFLRGSSGQPVQSVSGQGNPLLIGELVNEEGNISLPVIGELKVAGSTVFELQEQLRNIAVKYVESPTVRVRLLNYRVTVLGEINKEGTITLLNNRVSILEAIGLAGGLNELADKSIVKLIRQENGKAEIVYVNLLDENLLESPYYYVHQNDVLIVPPLKQRPFRKYFSQNFSLVLSVVTISLLIINLTR